MRTGSPLRILISACVLLLASPQSHAGLTLNVNDTVDLVDVSPGDGVCATETETCTLRAAIMEANASSGSELDVVIIPAGTYRLTLATPAGSDLWIDADGDLVTARHHRIRIVGAGAETTIIEQTTEARVLTNFGEASILGVTITGGFASRALRQPFVQYGSAGPAGPYGGGIFAFGPKTSLQNVVVEGNEAVGGGGGIVSFSSDLRLVGVRLSENRAQLGGGGLWAAGPTNARGVTVSGNRAPYGGGIVYRGEDKNFRLSNSIVSGNRAEGRRDSEGRLTSLGAGGGLLFNIGLRSFSGAAPPGLIEFATVRGNDAGKGAGIYHYGFGFMRLEKSLVAGNTATHWAGGLKVRGPLAVSNTTISGNHSRYSASGIDVQDPLVIAGGDRSDPDVGVRSVARLMLSHVTVARNTVDVSPFGIGLSSNSVANRIYATGTIFDNGATQNCSLAALHPFDSGGSNIDTGTTCLLSHATDLIGVDPLLDPVLADNGGPTLTHALQVGSPAIDNYAAAVLPCPPFDQRQGIRPSGSACDIGAVEQGAVSFEFFPPVSDLYEAAGGSIGLNFDGDWYEAISAEGISLAPLGAASGQANAVEFPISGGYLGKRWVQLAGRGGIAFTKGKHGVELYTMFLDLDKQRRGQVLTGYKSQRVNSRPLPLFELNSGEWGDGNVDANFILTRKAANYLNAQLKTRLFKAGMKLGVLHGEVVAPDNGGQDNLPPPPKDNLLPLQ